MGYAKVAIKGFSWLTLFRIITRAISFGKTIVLARFINPSQFGVFGIVMLVLSFIEVITETGVNVFLVQEKNNVDKYINSAWVVSILRGIIIAAAMIISSPFVADFFNAPEAQQLIVIASIIPFLRGFINPSVVKFQKDLKFQQEAYYRISLLVIEIIATVILLFVYPQTISLILGIIVGVICELILSFIVVNPRPKLEFNKEYLKLIINNGKWITGTVILNYGYERGDNIAVGRMLSSYSLGIYDMAYRIAMLPLTEIADMLVRVVFPVFVKISDDYYRLRRAFIKTVLSVSLIVIPFGIILFFFTREIVLLVLGEEWLEVVPVLKVLVVLGVVKAIANAIMSLQLALRMQKYITLTTFIGLVGLLTTVVPLVSMYGIVGAAYAATFGYFISVPFIVYFTIRSLQAVKNVKH
jgi:O-antigen/teichoic acid export membrane protein